MKQIFVKFTRFSGVSIRQSAAVKVRILRNPLSVTQKADYDDVVENRDSVNESSTARFKFHANECLSCRSRYIQYVNFLSTLFSQLVISMASMD